MVSHNIDAIEIVSQTLHGLRRADEQTIAAGLVLAERLERLKQLSGIFETVRFSPQMSRLMDRQPMTASV